MNNLELFESELDQDVKAFKSDFLNKNLLDDFIRVEQKWIKNNLEYIYSKEQKDITLTINPFHKIVTYEKEDADNVFAAGFIFLPKLLALNKLHIHYAELDKADLFFKSLLNYGNSFKLYEITQEITQNSTPEKKDILTLKINTMIRKFLSYQYLTIH